MIQEEIRGKLEQKLWTMSFLMICISSLSVYISFHSLLATLPVYIKQFGGSTATAGLALGVLTVAAVAIRPISGLALDLYGRKVIFLGGLLLFMLPTVAYIWMLPVSALLVLRFVQGLGWGICSTAAGTVASDVVPKSRLGEGLGYFSLTASFSLAIAPAFGLWLIDNLSFRALFITGSVLCIASILFALTIDYPVIHRQQTRAKLSFLEPAAIRPAFVVLLITITYSAVLSFLALFVRPAGLTAGVFFTTLAFTTLASRPIAGRLADNWGRRGYDLAMVLGIPCIIAAMIILSLTAGPWYLVAGGIFYGIGFGLVQASMLALCLQSVPSNRRGAANATYWTAFDIGVALGSILWGIVANAVGYPMMFALNGIPAALALAAYFFKGRAVS